MELRDWWICRGRSELTSAVYGYEGEPVDCLVFRSVFAGVSPYLTGWLPEANHRLVDLQEVRQLTEASFTHFFFSYWNIFCVSFIYSWCSPQSNCSQLSKITENQSIKILSLSLSLWFTRHLFGKVYYAFLSCCCNIVPTKQSILSGAFPECIISCFNYTFINSVNWR